MRGRRAFVFGLDCASPELWFARWREELPVISALCAEGTYGPLHSVHPPITIPAWAAMLTGCDPGQLGLYGFRGRRSRQARTATLHDATDLEVPTLWDLLGRDGRESIVVGFPPSYPPRPLRGHLVSGMLTPPGADDWTFPASLRDEVAGWVGSDRGYAFDAEAHRGPDPGQLRDEVFEMTRTRFDVVRRLVRSRPWDFGFVHEIGLDRLQHAYWGSLASPDSAESEILRDYHRLLDAEIGETLELLPDDAIVCVVSDHGARPFEGSFRLNEWLRRQAELWLGDDAGELDAVEVAERLRRHDFLRVLLTILGVVDFGMNIQEGLDAPRFHHQWLPDLIAHEHFGFSPDTRALLQAKGHSFNERKSQGQAQGIVYDAKADLLEGGHDKRAPDSAAIGH